MCMQLDQSYQSTYYQQFVRQHPTGSTVESQTSSKPKMHHTNRKHYEQTNKLLTHFKRVQHDFWIQQSTARQPYRATSHHQCITSNSISAIHYPSCSHAKWPNPETRRIYAHIIMTAIAFTHTHTHILCVHSLCNRHCNSGHFEALQFTPPHTEITNEQMCTVVCACMEIFSFHVFFSRPMFSIFHVVCILCAAHSLIHSAVLCILK